MGVWERVEVVMCTLKCPLTAKGARGAGRGIDNSGVRAETGVGDTNVGAKF